MTLTPSARDLAGDLVRHLQAAYAPDVEPDVDVPATTEKFTIDDEGRANWALRKIAETRAEIARVAAVADEETARIAAWRESLTGKAARTVAFFEAHLEAYTAARTDKKTRTLHLVAGDLCARRSQKVVVVDEAAVIAWLDEHAPDYVRRDPKILLGDLRGVLAADGDGVLQPCFATGAPAGEAIPGLKIDSDDVYSAKPAPLPDPDA